MSVIGYYVHHRGDGHRQRALAIAGSAPDSVVLLGTGLAGRCADRSYLDLDDDRPLPDGECAAAPAADCLHYAPLHHTGVQQRVAKIAAWIARRRPALMVVDVSVEIAMLARLSSIPTVYVRLAGRRDDAAHLQAFGAARLLLAPFHAELDDPSVPAWVRRKTRYVPGLTHARVGAAPATQVVLVVNGRGGGILDGGAIAAAATSTPEFHWRVIGPVTAPAECPRNLELRGWVDNAEEEIGNAGVVIGTGGDGVVSAAAAAGRPFVCLPQERPYDEQLCKARRLAALGAAVVLERLPQAGEWPDILRQAQTLHPARLSRLHDPNGIGSACALLHSLAER